MKVVLMLSLGFALAGCGGSDEVAAPAPENLPSLSLPNPESMVFADFLHATALLSQDQRVTFRHPELSMPIQFSIWSPGGGDPVDPLVIQLIGDQIRVDEALIDEAALDLEVKEFIGQSNLVREPPQFMIVASEEPPVDFDAGLKILHILAENGIDVVSLPQAESDQERSARIEREIKRKMKEKPSPPAPPIR